MRNKNKSNNKDKDKYKYKNNIVRSKAVNDRGVTVKRKRKITSIKKKIMTLERRKRKIDMMTNTMIAMNAEEARRNTKKRKRRKIKNLDLVRTIEIDIPEGLTIDICCKK